MGERSDRGCWHQHVPRGQRSIGSGRTVVSDDVCTGHEKKESSIDIPEEIRQKMSLDISTMISDAIDNKARAFGSKR